MVYQKQKSRKLTRYATEASTQEVEKEYSIKMIGDQLNDKNTIPIEVQSKLSRNETPFSDNHSSNDQISEDNQAHL